MSKKDKIEILETIMQDIKAGKFRDLVDLYKKCERTIEE